MTEAAADSAASWLAFLASPAAPRRAMSALELDGYLTGLVVSPDPLPPGRWMAGLWGDEEPAFDDAERLGSALAAIAAMSDALRAGIERSLRRLEAERVCDYRPAFLPEAGKPSRDAVQAWVGGFWKAMALDPAGWGALAEDERTQVVIEPFVGFIDLGRDEAFEPAQGIEGRLDEAATRIPRAILLLRKIAELRAVRTATGPATRRGKIGRNDPCSCGSGQKHKRCCGRT